MALPLTETDKFLLLSAVGAPESRDRITALLDLAGTGNMTGPAVAVDNAIVRFDGTTGALVQNSPVTISDPGVVSAAGALLSGLTASRALVSDASKNLVSSVVTSSELGFVSGVTSAIQTQLGNKLDLTGGIVTGLLSVSTSSGEQLRLIDGGTFGVNADPYLTFRDNASQGGAAGFLNAASNDLFIVNYRPTGSLSLAANNVVGVTLDQVQKVTLGASGGVQIHQVNGAVVAPNADVLTFTNGPTGTAGDPDIYLELNVNGVNYVFPGFAV